MKQIVKHSLVAAAAMMLVACGGGGDNAGACKYGTSCTASNTDTAASPATNGVANQGKLTIALEKWALNWTDQDDESGITVTVANTAGGPSPAGTTVWFNAEAGFLDSNSCVLQGKTSSGSEFAQCSVTFKPGNAAIVPTDGYATVLVYMEGEEAYVDVDSSKSYTQGDFLYETGDIFRDDDNDQIWTPISLGGIDTFSLKGAGSGSSACRQDPGIINNLALKPSSIDGTCDGKWGKTYISAQVYIPISRQGAVGVAGVGVVSPGVYEFISFSVAPGNVRVAPVADTSVTITGSGACTVGAVSNASTPSNAVEPVSHLFTYDPATCSGTTVVVSADSGGFIATTQISLP